MPYVGERTSPQGQPPIMLGILGPNRRIHQVDAKQMQKITWDLLSMDVLSSVMSKIVDLLLKMTPLSTEPSVLLAKDSMALQLVVVVVKVSAAQRMMV